MLVSHRARSPDFMGGFSNSFDSLNHMDVRSTYNPVNTVTVPFAYDCSLRRWRRVPRSFQPPPCPAGKTIQFFTWNLDFQAPYAADRAHAAMNHLSKNCARSEPAIINLQEVNMSALDTILRHSWIREFFKITDVEPVDRCRYFTVTLISLSLPVAKVTRIPFNASCMERDVLIVDIELERNPRSYSVRGCGVLRIANVHLESTIEGIRERPLQMQTVAKMLKQPQVVAGVVGGDVNALLKDDQRLPQMNGLRDAFYRVNGYGCISDVEEQMGYTWGIEGRSSLPPTRRDKVLYTGNVSFPGGVIGGGKIVRRIGVRLECEAGGRGYISVSDHCGLATHITVGSHRRRGNRLVAYVS